MASTPTILTPPPEPGSKEVSAEERRRLREQIDRVIQEKEEALRDPGPSWREWVYYEALRWWLAIGLLILDSFLAVQWLTWGSYLGLGASLAPAVYAEFLLYRYLWTRPAPPSTRRRGPFRRSWYRPVEYGRWTPEADYARAHGRRPEIDSGGPAPEEFL